MVFSLFAGLLVVNTPSVANAALPSVLPNGDLVIGSDYQIANWPADPDLHGATHIMDGNLTIRAGGTVAIRNGTLSFAQDLGPDRQPNTGDEHIYTLTIEDGGSLILDNATLTTHLDQISDYPSLGVLVQNGGSIIANDSQFVFPGQMVVDDSTMVFNNVVFKGLNASELSKYCDQKLFPSSEFDSSAVLYISSSQVQMFDSRIQDIFEGIGDPQMVGSNYAFATGTSAMDLVRYTLGRHVTAYGAGNQVTDPIGNLSAADQSYATVTPGSTLAIDATAMKGLVFPASAAYTVTLNVLYKTDYGYSPVNYVQWGYQNGGLTSTGIQPSDTHRAYDQTTNSDRLETYTMPFVSSADLSNLNISYLNSAGSGGNIYFNKIWFTVSFQEPTYRNLTLAGSTDFTAVDTMIGVDFANDSTIHNQLNVMDNAKAYLYGVYSDRDTQIVQNSRIPAFNVTSNSMEVFAIAKNTALDNTGSSLAALRAVDGSFYDVNNAVMAIQSFAAGGITGQLTSCVLNVTSSTSSSYVDGAYVQYGTNWGSMKDSSVRPAYNGGATTNAKFDLYSAGITDLAALSSLKLMFTNTQAQLVRFSKISVEITTGPSIYMYRWLDLKALDEQSLPISGMPVNASLLTTGAAAQYISGAGVQSAPPSAVLAYMGKSASNYTLTDNSGSVRIPLLSEILTEYSQMPNMQVLGAYSLAMRYRNATGSVFNGASTVSFEIYPALDEAAASSRVDFTMSDLYLDKPDLVISYFVASPSPLYLGDTATLTAIVSNIGLTGAIDVLVNFTDSLTSWGYNATIPFLGPEQSVEIQTTWTATPSGSHTLTVKADPLNKIIESNHNNNDRSIQVNVLPNLPELAIASSDITFVPQPANTSSPVLATVTVSNLAGRADAKNVTVSFYIGDPRSGGQLLGTTLMNISRGTTNFTTFSWVQSQIGTYQVYVWVNKERNPAEYNYTNNLASKQIIVNLSITGTDLLVNDHNTTTFAGTQFTYRGRIIIRDHGTLVIENAGLVIDQNNDNQFQIYVQGDGRLVLSSATLSSGKYLWVYLNDNATMDVSSSSVSANIRISLGDRSSLNVTGSVIGSDIVTQSNSQSVLRAWNSTFLTAWSNFGGSAKAYLTSIVIPSVPAIQPKEAAVVYLYRWVDITVLDGNNKPLPNAHVVMSYYLGTGVYAQGTSDSKGVALFAGLANVIDSSGYTFVGNYKLNATYWFSGVPYSTNGTSPVSLAPYSQNQPLDRNDWSAALAIPNALPDLDPPLLVSNKTPYRGDSVTLTTYVHNVGVVVAYNVLVQFKDGSTIISNVVLPVVNPGDNLTARAVWVAVAPLGAHNISVAIDPENAIKELNKNNNANWTFVTVRGIAELYASASDVSIVTNLPSASPTTNTTASVSITVHNSGDVAANNVNVSFTDVKPGGAQVLIGYGMVSNIPENGGTGVATVAWTPNIPGAHTLLIKINVGIPPVPETQTSNNNVSYPVQVMNYADLTPTSISFTPPTIVYVGTTVTISTTIANIGQTRASGIIVQFREGHEDGKLLDTQTIAYLDPTQSTTVSGSWIVDAVAGQKVQMRNITVIVNPAHIIREITYANNARTQQVMVIDARPDLQFVGGIDVTTGSTSVTSAVVGEAVVVHVTIVNDGYTPAMGAQIQLSAIDSDNFTTNLVTVTRDFQANQTLAVDLNWIVNLTIGQYTLRVDVDPHHLINETNENNNYVTSSFLVNPPAPKITVYTGSPTYNPDSEVSVFGSVLNSLTNEPLASIPVTIFIVDASKTQVGDNQTVLTTPTGDYSGTLTISASVQPGYYTVHAVVKTGNRTVTAESAAFQVQAKASETALPFWIWILVFVVVAAVIIIGSYLLYRNALGRMVECGECGALVPESSKRCPKCGVEFETGTAKCSQCGAWIPANSTECPECGAKFVNQPLAEEESDYIKQMRQQYEVYVDQYREQAKGVLGKKYSEPKFQEWWKKQPSFITFERWLSQEEDKRKTSGAAYPCPVCGTLNPKGATVCHKCGTVFEKALGGEEPGAPPAQPEAAKPTRRIVRRPAEKKVIPKKPEEGGVPPEGQGEQQGPEDQPKP